MILRSWIPHSNRSVNWCGILPEIHCNRRTSSPHYLWIRSGLNSFGVEMWKWATLKFLLRPVTGVFSTSFSPIQRVTLVSNPPSTWAFTGTAICSPSLELFMLSMARIGLCYSRRVGTKRISLHSIAHVPGISMLFKFSRSIGFQSLEKCSAQIQAPFH